MEYNKLGKIIQPKTIANVSPKQNIKIIKPTSLKSFEEFFIWWYHFIYTKVTDILAENRVLTIPKEGNIYSLIVR